MQHNYHTFRFSDATMTRARYYQPNLSIWLSVDPMADKYPGVSPYTYCGNNPIKLVDPNGEKVKPFGETALETIKNTLKKEDRSHIKLNKQGLIRKLPLLLHKSESQNYASLKELVLSKHIVEIHTSDYFSYIDNNGASGTQKMSCSPYNPQLGGIKDVACEYVSGLSTGECGWYGETLFPDNKGPFNSTNANIQIYLHSSLSKVGMAEAFSHEGYGHALLYERNGGDHLGASHKPHGLTETNIVLKNMIITARRETLQNIEQ